MSSRDDYLYTVSLELEYKHLRFLYETVAKAVETWPGGEEWQQEFLEEYKRELWKMVMEAQFGESSEE